jgi:hypothetical protein
MSPCLYVSGIHKQKLEIMENGNFSLFAPNRKQAWQTEMKKKSLFS